MIPKVIHYCWFGRKPLPTLAQKCITSWEKYLPDYTIKEWNEDNFDLNCCDYVKEAYQAKKWAFVSDYARFWILYNYGGLYFDTDVEIIKDMSGIIAHGAFMGCETVAQCAPGLGLGAEPGLGFYKEVLEYYNNLHFTIGDGNILTVVNHVSSLLERHGWEGKNDISEIEGISIYPPDFFCPYCSATGEMNITSNTVSIHHYAATWHSKLDDIIANIERCDRKKYPVRFKMKRCLSLLFRIMNKIQKVGLYEALRLSKRWIGREDQ